MRIRFIPAELAWDSYEGVTQVLWGRKFQQKFLLYRNPLTGQICWKYIFYGKKVHCACHIFACYICEVRQYLQSNISSPPLGWHFRETCLIVHSDVKLSQDFHNGQVADCATEKRKDLREQIKWTWFGNPACENENALFKCFWHL